MEALRKLSICALLCFFVCSLTYAQKATPIEVKKGNFEDEESALGLPPIESKGDTWADWTFTEKGWGLAPLEDVGEGETSVVLMAPASVTLNIPPELKGQSLELTFIGKGDASFSSYHGTDTTLIKALNVKKGAVVKETELKSIYTNFVGNKKYPQYTKFKILFPPLPEDTNKVVICINHNNPEREYISKDLNRKFFIDSVKVRAINQRFYSELKTTPAEIGNYKFDSAEAGANSLGNWSFEADKAKQVKDEKTGKTVLALKKGANLKLPLPLDKFKDNSVEILLKARGKGKLETNIETGKPGALKASFRSPSNLTPDTTSLLTWFVEVPAAADKLELNIAASEVAEIEDIKINLSKRPLVPYPANLQLIPGEKLPDNYVEGRNPPAEGMVNIAPYAEIMTDQFNYRPWQVSDGSFGSQTKGVIKFHYDKPQKISEIRLTIPQSSILIYADMKGDGNYDTPVVEDLRGLSFSTWGNMQEYVWFRKTFDTPLVAYGIKYIGTAHEFQILSKASDAAEIVKEKAEPMPDSGTLLSLGEKIEVADAPEKDRLKIGFTFESWMFGVPNAMTKYYKSNTTPSSMSEWPEWKKILEDYKDLKMNFILLFPPQTNVMPVGVKPRGGAYPTPPMWPSEVWYVSQPFNLLKDMMELCKKNDIIVFTIPREWMFKEGLQNPQVLYAKEIAEQGSDGVPVCVDEQAIGTKSPFPRQVEIKANAKEKDKEAAEKENARVAAFQSRWNTKELPTKEEDSEIYRKFHLWNLENIAKWMNDINTVSKAVNPNSLTFGGFSSTDYYRNRFATVSDLDIWGFQGNVDIIGGDATYFGIGDGDGIGSFQPAIGTQGYRSRNPGRHAMATCNFNWGIGPDEKTKKMKNPLVYDDYPDMSYYGGALSAFFNKADYLDYWRYNYMYARSPGTRDAVKRAGHMVATLSAWGGKKAQIPKDVIVLRSRASEDWWMLKSMFDKAVDAKSGGSETKWWLMEGENEQANKSARQTQGYTQYFWVMTQLNDIAIPHEVYFQDQPKAYADEIAKFKVLLLPFPYSVSEEEFAIIKKAVDAGVKVIALGGCGQGPTDWIGNPYKKPILEDLIKEGKITYFDIDVINNANTSKLRKDFKDTLLKLLGENRSLTLTRQRDYDVQANILEVSENEKLVLLSNWSERDTSVNIGVRMPPGTYKMMSRNLDDVTSAKLAGKDSFTEKELKNFRVDLKKEEAKILRIYK